jgi:hypothetical protein
MALVSVIVIARIPSAYDVAKGVERGIPFASSYRDISIPEGAVIISQTNKMISGLYGRILNEKFSVANKLNSLVAERAAPDSCICDSHMGVESRDLAIFQQKIFAEIRSVNAPISSVEYIDRLLNINTADVNA